MVVDDNPANLKLLEEMLRQQGCEVSSFPGARLAIAAAKRNPPDLILLDITMPEMNGYEVCERLKSTEELSHIPVIFLSALNEIEDKVKAFRSGGVDYICKPFQFEEVHARVEIHLKLHALRQELKLQNERLDELVGRRTEQLQVALKQMGQEPSSSKWPCGRLKQPMTRPCARWAELWTCGTTKQAAIPSG